MNYVDGCNMYEFVRGNPTSYVDPFGFEAMSINIGPGSTGFGLENGGQLADKQIAEGTIDAANGNTDSMVAHGQEPGENITVDPIPEQEQGISADPIPEQEPGILSDPIPEPESNILIDPIPEQNPGDNVEKSTGDGITQQTTGEVKGPYSHLEDPESIAPGKDYTPSQKKKILEENRRKNNGVLRDDETGEILSEPQKSQKGVTPPTNEAQVDHIKPKNPKDENVEPGSNSYSNARVISRERNIQKSNNYPF
ncbi:MAG: hypothetical protein ACD_9C00006G0002 [uncultured bacterium]|nr:MAG: hypothetical protein ACD_9C00006G0002 [uncultured bacterium]